MNIMCAAWPESKGGPHTTNCEAATRLGQNIVMQIAGNVRLSPYCDITSVVRPLGVSAPRNDSEITFPIST